MNERLRALSMVSARLEHALADSFEASLALEFESGLLLAGEQLRVLAERGGDLTASATFGAAARGVA